MFSVRLISTACKRTTAKAHYNRFQLIKHTKIQYKCLSSTSGSQSQPAAVNKEIAYGINDATSFFMRHGVGIQRLKSVSKNNEDVDTLVLRWQKMMEAYLGMQVHVLAGLGYVPNESGNNHVLSPDD